jgi:hypothetical protein
MSECDEIEEITKKFSSKFLFQFLTPKPNLKDYDTERVQDDCKHNIFILINMQL